MLNVTKVRTAVENAVKELDTAYDAALAAGKKDPQVIDGLRPLGKANLALTKALKALDLAVEKTTPKENTKKEKKAKS